MPSETSADIAARVAHAREMQEARFKDNPNIFNKLSDAEPYSPGGVPGEPGGADAGEEGNGEAAAFGAGV